MIRIHIKNLSADLEFEVGTPSVRLSGDPTISRADIERVFDTTPLDIPGMSPAFAEGDLQGLFDKVQEVFKTYEPQAGVPLAQMSEDTLLEQVLQFARSNRRKDRDVVVQVPGPVELEPVEVKESDETVAKAKMEPLDAQQVVPITFRGTTFNLAFVGSHVLIPVTRAFEFTGFKNAHHLWEVAQEKGEAFFVRMEIDPEATRRSLSCVTLAGLDIAWSEAKRRMNKRQIIGQHEDIKAEEFNTLRTLIVDAGIRLQRELLGLADDPQKVMYATDADLAGLLNKQQLLSTLLSAGEMWTKDRLDRILVDQGILRADSLTWGKTELGNVTQHAVRNGFVKILSVRCERKENPGQDTRDAYVQRWKPYFTQKTVDYILSGPQGDVSSWGLTRVEQLEEAQTPLPVDAQVPPLAPDSTPSDSDNK